MITNRFLKLKLHSCVHTVACWIVISYNVVGGYYFVLGIRCILKIEALYSSETLVTIHQISRYHNKTPRMSVHDR